nr:hypothetical protein [Tanacetum cinerariifolium]
QQNGVAKRRNRTLIEAARTMLADAKLHVTFLADAIRFLKPFGCHVMILNTLDNLEKFEAKWDEGYFIGYSIKPYEESISQVPEGSGNPNPTASAFIPSADQMETLTLESPISTVSSPVPTACLNDSSEPSSEA